MNVITLSRLRNQGFRLQKQIRCPQSKPEFFARRGPRQAFIGTTFDYLYIGAVAGKSSLAVESGILILKKGFSDILDTWSDRTFVVLGVVLRCVI